MQQVFSSAATLRDVLRTDLEQSREFSSPVVRVGHDGTKPVWSWLLPLVRLRSDWVPLVGAVLRHFASEGDPFTHIAIADLVGAQRHCVALLPAMRAFAQPLADVHMTWTPTWWSEDGAVTLGKVLAAHEELLAELCDPARPAWLEGRFGPKTSMVEMTDADDLREALRLSAKRGRFKWTEWGDHPLSWLYPEALGRPWIDPLLGELLPPMLNGTHAEVITALDWMLEKRDLWRYVDALQAASIEPPWWWEESSATKPKGWRKPWPITPFLRGKPLSAVVEFLLPLAQQQAALAPVQDLPELGTA